MRAIGILGGADEGAELHAGRGPAAGFLCRSRNEGIGEAALHRAEVGGWKFDALPGASEHPANVDIEHGGARTEGEGQDGIGCVIAHPGKGDQLGVGGRNLTSI